MKYLLYTISLISLAIVCSGIYFYVKWNQRSDIAAYDSIATIPDTGHLASLRVTFMGVATILLDDGDTAILTDGFFTRPSLRQLLLDKISPNSVEIDKAIRRAGISRLAAVIVNHSHYDHVMDAPEVAMRTNAMLVGSESSANVGRGDGMPENRIVVIRAGDSVSFGKFHVTFLASRHTPSPFTGGEILEPLRPPSHASAYKEGGSFALLVEHENRRLLITASAGFLPGSMVGKKVDVVFLGIGALGTHSNSYMSDYWQEMVEETGARRVIPIHWDDFTRPLDLPLLPIPNLFDDFSASMRFLTDRSRAAGIDLRLPQVFAPFDPFYSLPVAKP